jgi:hypothetical protein
VLRGGAALFVVVGGFEHAAINTSIELKTQNNFTLAILKTP